MLSWKTAVLKKLEKKLGLKSTELLVLLIFFLFSLRVLSWFEYPYIMISGDFRPPLVREAFLKRILYTWDEIDFGVPSVYSPRILDPLYFFVTGFQTLGISLYFSQIIAVILMYFFASILMYIYVRQITNGDIITAFIAALFLTSNVHLIVDREITATGFINVTLMILPCLVVFIEGIKKKSYTMMTLSGLLFVLTYGGFPNYRVVLLCFITLMLTFFFIYINSGLKITYNKNGISKFLNASFNIGLIHTYLKYLSVFILSLTLVSTWVIGIVLTNFDAFSMTYKQMAAPAFAPYAQYIQSHDLLRLIARWSFYETALGKPYVPYANVYLHNPLIIILSYLPSILAFASLLASKSRKLTIYFSGVAVLSLILTSAFSPYLIQLYLDLVAHIPLMRAFRESIHWIFFVILSYSILIGITLSTLCHRFRNKALKIFALSLTIALFLSTTYPLMTGDVTRNFIYPEIKGSYFPPSYVELNSMLPSEYWAIMLPQRRTYLVYNFSGGPLPCGNPYPLIFSKPIISGAGTEYIQSENSELINELHKRIRTNIKYKNVAPEGKISASSNETNERTPDKAIDGQMLTRWASKVGVPQWLEIEWNKAQELSKIKIFFESAYADDYIIETWNGSDWKTQIIVENNISTECEHVFPKTINTTRLRLSFTRASSFGLVSIWELEVYARTEGVPKFLGMLGIKYLILEKNIKSGNTYSVSVLKLHENKNFTLVKEWEEVALFENAYALKKLYVADNILNFSTSNDMYKLIENSEWNTLKHSVFINTTSPNEANKTLIEPKNLIWKELSPTKYEANVESNGSFILVFLESYDKNWKAYVNGNLIPETNHLKVNAFANGWLIDATGNLTITIQYETQNLFTISVIASVILPVLLLTFLSRQDIKRVVHTIQRKFKRKN